MKVLSLRRDDVCACCSTDLQTGTRAAWDAQARRVTCLACATTNSPPLQDQTTVLAPTDAVAPACRDAAPSTPSASASSAADAVLAAGTGGASAQREHDRRSARRAAGVRARHPRLGALLLVLSGEPASTRVWAQGAAGERAVAARLQQLTGHHVVALHDRAMRRADGHLSRANIDHLVVTAAGVWVIDAKTQRGALQVRRSGGFFSPRTERLLIAGRDRSALLDGLAVQVEAVKRELAAAHGSVPVRGALCFVGTALPWTGQSIRGVPLVGLRGLERLVSRPGDLGAAQCEAMAGFLAGRFPAAG